MNFLILGLPRSRTAWLANFMTYDGLHCTHEGLANYTNLEDYRNSFGENCGDSNTLLMSFDFMPYFQDTKIVIIDSDVQRAIDFGKDMFGVEDSHMILKAKQQLADIDGLHIKFEDINKRVDDIWNYITDKPFDKKRADMLIELNVQMQDVHSIDTNKIEQLMENECVTLI